MARVVSKYLIPVVECLARLYNGVEPVGIRSLQLCMNSRGVRDVNYTYRGLEAGVKLGLVKEVPYGKSVKRYMPTLDGVVKGAVLSAVSDVLGVVGNDALEYMYPLTLVIYSNILIELPGLIAASLTSPQRSRGLTVTCCDSFQRCFTETIIPSREDIYFGLITVKAIAGVPVRGLRPTDYGELYYYVRAKATYYLQRGLGATQPDRPHLPPCQGVAWATGSMTTRSGGPISTLITTLTRALAQLRLSQRLVEIREALGY